MSKQSPSLLISPGRSRCLGTFIVLTHLLALAALWLAAIPAWLRILTSLMLLWQFLLLWRRYMPAGAPLGIRELAFQADGHCRLRDIDGHWHEVSNWDAPLVLPRLVLLRFRSREFRGHSLPLCSDSLAPDLHRQLRVLLKTR